MRLDLIVSVISKRKNNCEMKSQNQHDMQTKDLSEFFFSRVVGHLQQCALLIARDVQVILFYYSFLFSLLSCIVFYFFACLPAIV